MTTVLRFATTTPPNPVIVDTVVSRNVKSDDSSTFRDDFRLSGKSDASPTLRERLRTLANTNATTSRRLLDPWTPTLKREPFCYAFGNMRNLPTVRSSCLRRLDMIRPGHVGMLWSWCEPFSLEWNNPLPQWAPAPTPRP